jgi:membrane protein implicated in regulation of membrane protease activity
MDGLAAFFLVCFGVGLAMVVLAVLTGIGHESLHFGHVDLHLPWHAAGAAHAGGTATGHTGGDLVSPFNAMTLFVFLTWFGGAGYVLHGPLGSWGWLSLLGAALAGLVAAAAVFQFLARVLVPRSKPLDPADYVLEGQVGTVSSPIRPGGVGEVQYVQRGRRRSIGARAIGTAPLERGTEVVIVTVERGLARVEPWEQFIAARDDRRPGTVERTVQPSATMRPAEPGPGKE